VPEVFSDHELLTVRPMADQQWHDQND